MSGRPPAPGPWLLARGVRAPWVLVGAAVVVGLFSLIRTQGVPAGVLTAAQPLVMPLYLVQPTPLAMVVTAACLSPASVMEAGAPRRVRAWHAAVLVALVALVVLLLVAQPNLPSEARPMAVVSFLGSLGLALVGVAVAGAAGWVVPLGYLVLLAVIGTDDLGRPALWAWSLRPLDEALPLALALLAVGCTGLGLRWRRVPVER